MVALLVVVCVRLCLYLDQGLDYRETAAINGTRGLFIHPTVGGLVYRGIMFREEPDYIIVHLTLQQNKFFTKHNGPKAAFKE